MSLAACESVASIQPVGALPRATAWAIIQWYYAAFYAAHAMLRMCGTALVQLEGGHVSELRRVANGMGHPCSVSSGFHAFTIDFRSGRVQLDKMTADGSHEFLWQQFESFLRRVSADLLSTPGASLDIQQLALRLDDLRTILNTPPAQRGTWLSYVRNRVSYRHEFSAWYPYPNSSDDDLAMFQRTRPTPEGAEAVQLVLPLQGRPLSSFTSACRYVVALCYDTAKEMTRRSTTRAHFHAHGMLQLDKMLRQP